MTGEAPLALVMDPRPNGVHLLCDADEHARAQRFVDASDARAFLVGRTLTRVAAAVFRGSPAAEVLIRRRCAHCGGPHGRPTALEGPAGLSSSRRRSVVGAVASWSPVAIDVEPLTAGREVPQAYLSPTEQATNPTPLGRLILWTRKECLVKLGHCELDDFPRVTVGSPAERVAIVDDVRFDTTVLLGAVVTIATEALTAPAVHVIGAKDLSRLASVHPE